MRSSSALEQVEFRASAPTRIVRDSTQLRLGVAVGVAALAAAARIPGAVRDALWEDEIASAHVLIQGTPWGMAHQVARTEATPPLWYALGWLAHQLGLSVQGYRAMSVLAGALLAGGTVLLASRMLPVWASALAGVLVAFGWQLVMHGRELRAYELFALLTAVFAWTLLRERSSVRPAGWRKYALAVAVAGGSLTSYFFLLSVAAGLLWLWFDPRLGRARVRIAAQIGLGLIPLAAWSPVLVHQYIGQRFSWIGPFSLRGLTDVYWQLFAHHVPAGAAGDVLPLVLLAGVIAGCALLTRTSEEGTLVALLALTPVVLCGLAWLAGAHVFDPRNLLGAGPFAAIALAAVVAWLWRPMGYAAAIVATAGMAIAVVRAESTPPTAYDKVSQLLVKQGWRASDPVVLFGTFGDFFAFRSPLEWYLPEQPVLTLGEPARGPSCGAVYALTASPEVWARISRSGLVATWGRAGDVLVARLRVIRPPGHGMWRTGHVLVGRNAQPACVRLVPEAQIVSRLRG
jgi:hypothetical protein